MAEADEELRKAAATAFPAVFDGVIRVEPDGAAPFWIDGRVAPPAVLDRAPAGAGDEPEESAGLCRWFAARDTLLRVLEEERFLANAFVSGRLVVSGDMSVMARLELARAHG